MAESKRRGEDAVDERLDDAFDDAADDDALDQDEVDEAPVSGRRGGTAVKTRTERADSGKAVRVATDERVGIIARIGRFVREVVAELRKVIWPTRKELVTYAVVVVVFVAVLMTIVALLDAGFAWAVLHVFGGSKK